MGRFIGSRESLNYGFKKEVSSALNYDGRNYLSSLERRSNSEQALKITIKRGVTKFSEPKDSFDEKLVHSTKMLSNMFDLEQLKQSNTFGVKNYKDSYYIGELDPETSMRDGLGICVYNS